MAGIYEVRTRHGDQLHRLFRLLDRNHPDGPALVMLDGDSKPNRARLAASTSMERRIYLPIGTKGVGLSCVQTLGAPAEVVVTLPGRGCAAKRPRPGVELSG